MSFKDGIELAGKTIDAAGVAVIGTGLLAAAARYLVQRRNVSNPFRSLRQDIGRAILLGLELLVAADIIRTFLSVALQVELEGEWPWRRSRT